MKIAVSVAVVLALVSLALFVRYIHHIEALDRAAAREPTNIS